VGTLVDQSGRVVCERCERADTLASRTKGLLGRSGLGPGEGLLISKTASVHTFFMRFPIDVVFLDRKFRVRSISRELAAFRLAGRLGPGHVLELAAGEATRAGIEKGNQLAWHPAQPDGPRDAKGPQSF
jgi:uncharacterized membrane protein (UPF0127 family)